MSYSVDWNTRIITIHTSDMIDKGNSIYELAMDSFHTEIRRLEWDFSEGLSRVQVLDYVPPVTLSGVVYSAFYVVINGYTITFEDGLYSVNLVGGNNNIADVTNKNSVSVNSSNSAGLTQPLSMQDIRDSMLLTPSQSVAVDSIDAKITSVPGAVAERIYENGMTLEHMLRIIYAAVAGSSYGAGTANFGYKSADGSKNRIESSVDGNNNRIVNVVDGT